VNRVARFAACAICLALAPLLLVQAGANGNPPGGPMLAHNGFNLAAMSLSGLRLREDGETTTVVVDEGTLDYARRAFAREPLATDALFMLAVDERARLGDAGAQGLLDAAAALDRRNRFLSALQVEQAVRRRDFAGMSAIIDRMARIQPDLTVQFVSPLVAALTQEELLAPMADILAQNPAWAHDFWMAVPGDGVLVERLYRLRQMTGQGADAESDARLMAALAAIGRYDDAFAFRDQAAGAPVSGSGFVPVGGVPPFGWATQTSGERSMTPRGEDRYEVFVQQGMEGELGRQLLRLAPGTYRFDAAVTPLSSAANVTARLRCAADDDLASDRQPLDRPATFTVPASCRNWWLVLEGSAWQARGGLRAEIAAMRFAAGR